MLTSTLILETVEVNLRGVLVDLAAARRRRDISIGQRNARAEGMPRI
jgi:hypothetical protein